MTKALIVTKGIDVNIKDKNKKTPLHLALMNGHADVVYSLVRNGADVNIQDEYGMPPAFLAIRRDYVFTLPKKREGSYVNVKNHARTASRNLAKEENNVHQQLRKVFFR